jgi:hypothetical protein
MHIPTSLVIYGAAGFLILVALLAWFQGRKGASLIERLFPWTLTAGAFQLVGFDGAAPWAHPAAVFGQVLTASLVVTWLVGLWRSRREPKSS